jgi:hypothetical protein
MNTLTPADRTVFLATPDYPVTVYYCKANIKTGNTVRIVQGRNIADCSGVSFSSPPGRSFAASMIHGNSRGKAKASGARCVLTVTQGTITPTA